jgi:tetratricopeptide (TPR) repeat protein
MLRNSAFVLLFAWLVVALPGLAQEGASLPFSELTDKLERALGLVEEDSKESRAQALSLLDEVERNVQILVTTMLEQADSEERKQALATLGRYKMNCSTTKAMIFARQGEHQRATSQFDNLTLYLTEHGDVFSRGNTLKAWADLLQEVNKPAEAAHKYAAALALFETRAEEFSDFIRYTRLSYFQSLEALGRSEEALAQLELLLQESEAIEDETKRGRALQLLYFSRGFFNLRLGYQQEARADLEALKALPYVQARPSEHFRAAVSLATVIQREGDLAARRALLEEAESALLKLKPEEVSPADLGLFYLFKGSMELAEENTAEGLEYLNKADELHKLSGQGACPRPSLLSLACIEE